MEAILYKAIYQGVEVDLIFRSKQPMFGDLFLICGYSHPDFPPSNNFQFDKLAQLKFSQVDDFFGVENTPGSVVVWLFPLVDDEGVFHHPGPFTGLRLSYNILRNLHENKTLFLRAIHLFRKYLDVNAVYKLRNLSLGESANFSVIEKDIDEVVGFWKEKNIETGSSDALSIAY